MQYYYNQISGEAEKRDISKTVKGRAHGADTTAIPFDLIKKYAGDQAC